MVDRTEPEASPNLGNAFFGVAGIGARAVAGGTVGAVAAGRTALRPVDAAGRAVLRSPPGDAVRREATALFEALDDAGRRDLARARASFGRTLDDSIDRAIDGLLGSPRSERVIERILESEVLWTLVDRIANSAEVLDAITSTSAGLAGEVAGEARRRTVAADDVAERIARRLLRRAPREQVAPMEDPGVAEPLVPQR